MKPSTCMLLVSLHFFFYSCGPSAREIEEKRIADSIRMADSIMMVERDKFIKAYNSMSPSDQNNFNRNIGLEKKEDRKNNTISANELYQAYDDNEVKAEQDFGMKKFYIEGIVKDIVRIEPGVVHIFLETDYYDKWVICVYKNEPMTAKFISKEKKITFLGTCTGFGTQRISIFMDECELVDNL